jgi:hypothetical protein
MKQKTKWNFWMMFEKSCDKVVKLQKAWGGLIAVVGASTWYSEVATSDQLLIIGVVGFLGNELIGGIYFEDETYKGRI